ncbi:MAG: hypothetical protein LH609_00190 [Rudanella sp.]|nr:hypothetical protein [Rudanella sp.]
MLTIQIDDKDPTLLGVYFPGNPIGNDLIRNVPGRRFSYSRKGWTVPNTRESVVQIGQLFGKEYCRFDEAVVRLYKPTASAAEIEQATGTPDRNPAWPPLNKRIVGTHRLPFRYAPPMREYDRHPVVVAVSEALRIQLRESPPTRQRILRHSLSSSGPKAPDCLQRCRGESHFQGYYKPEVPNTVSTRVRYWPASERSSPP